MLRSATAGLCFWIFATTEAPAVDEPLPLRHGTFVTEDQACAEPPAVATYGYNGKTFAMGHNGCEFQSVENQGNGAYDVTLSCSDLPASSGMTVMGQITTKDQTHFEFGGFDGSDSISARWCGE